MSGYAAANFYKGGMKSLREHQKQLEAQERESAEAVHDLSLLVENDDEWEKWWDRVPEDASYSEITALARESLMERRQETSLRHGG